MDYIRETLLRQAAIWRGFFTQEGEETSREEEREALFDSAGRDRGSRAAERALERRFGAEAAAEALEEVLGGRGAWTEAGLGRGEALTVNRGKAEALWRALSRDGEDGEGRGRAGFSREKGFQRRPVASRADAVDIEGPLGRGGEAAGAAAAARLSRALEEDARRYDGGFPLY